MLHSPLTKGGKPCPEESLRPPSPLPLQGKACPADELRSHSPLTKGRTGRLAEHAHPYARVPNGTLEKESLVRWPVRVGSLAGLAGEAGCQGQQRQVKEAAGRERWLQELQQLLIRAQLPAAACEGACSVRVAKGRRASTLEGHVRTWRRVADWVQTVFGCHWPSSDQFVAYLVARAAQPCGKTVPAQCYKTLLFIEAAGEVAHEARISSHPAVLNTLEELKVSLSAGRLGPPKQALQLFVSQVCSMERLVLAEQMPRYVRAFAWFKLLKLWGCLRYADTEGMPASSVVLEARGLRARLDRTKTSGAGKRLEVLHAFVSKSAWLQQEGWLDVGWQLWCDMASEINMGIRDFFLLKPGVGLQCCCQKMASYHDASAMSQALFQMLQVDGSPLMLQELGVLWSEHSERATLRSWATSCKIREVVIKQMGRWQPSASEAYVRSVRAGVEKAQAHIAKQIRQSLRGGDFLDETSIMVKVSELLISLGCKEERVDEQIDALRSFAALGPASPSWGPGCSNGSSASSTDASGSDVEDAQPASVLPSGASHMGMYFVNRLVSCKHITLHKGGECHRVPGVHCNNVEFLGNEMPKADLYTRVCKDCFPNGVLWMSDPESSESS